VESLWADLDGLVHYADFGGRGPALVMVHGLAGSHLNWLGVGPALSTHHHALAPDLAGFGRTPLAGRAASVPANRKLLDRFLREVAGTPAVLVGNSMGGLISLMQAAEAPETVAALVLVDPAAPHPRRAPVEARVWGLFAGLLLPGLSEALVRASLRRSDPARVVAQVLALTCADPSRVDPEITAAHVRLAQDGLARPQTERALAMAARSLVAVLSRRRAFRQMVDRVTAPTLVVHGAKDRVVPLGASQLLVRQRPDWELAVLPDLGHVPMLEDPPSFLATVEPWLASVRTAATIQSAPGH
jgi:pimeloyl-ACP methyl ester carboxylesterase